MSQVAHGVSSIHVLPTDLLAEVLQHLKQTDRLQCCALVCKRWQQVSNMATSRVLDFLSIKRNIKALHAWLHSDTNASSIQGIQWRHFRFDEKVAPVLQLPAHRLAALEKLELGYCHLKATPPKCNAQTMAVEQCPVAASAFVTSAANRTQSSPLAALTSLRRLQLRHTELDLSDLGSCTALRHLDLNMVWHVATADPAAAEAGTEHWHYRQFPPQLGAALPQLTQLTFLDLHFNSSEDDDDVCQSAAAVCLSSLQQLRSLKLSGTSAAFINLREMPATLTTLHLAADLPGASMPYPLLMPQLQRLHIRHNINLHCMSLSNVTQLTWLYLDDCEVEDDEAVKGIMSALAQMKHLKHLCFRVFWFGQDEESQWQAASPELLAAVAACKNLTFLDLNHCELPVAANVNIHMFSVANALKDLQVLRAGSALFTEAGSFERLVACCPTLEQLHLELEYWIDPLEEDVRLDLKGLSALQSLTALTKLTIRRIHLTDDAVRTLAGCTRLRDLKLYVYST